MILCCTWGVKRLPVIARRIILWVICSVESFTRSLALSPYSAIIPAIGWGPKLLGIFLFTRVTSLFKTSIGQDLIQRQFRTLNYTACYEVSIYSGDKLVFDAYFIAPVFGIHLFQPLLLDFCLGIEEEKKANTENQPIGIIFPNAKA